MTNHEHPIRKAKLHVFRRFDHHEGGAKYIARFSPYDTWPIFFSGESAAQAIKAGETFRTEALDQHEQAYQNRMAGRDKAKAAREAKKGAAA